MPDSSNKFNSERQLTRQDVQFFEDQGVEKVRIALRSTKTRRAMDGPLKYTLEKIEGSKLCGWEALRNMHDMIPAEGEVPCFQHPDGKPFTYPQFTKRFRQLLDEL